MYRSRDYLEKLSPKREEKMG